MSIIFRTRLLLTCWCGRCLGSNAGRHPQRGHTTWATRSPLQSVFGITWSLRNPWCGFLTARDLCFLAQDGLVFSSEVQWGFQSFQALLSKNSKPLLFCFPKKSESWANLHQRSYLLYNVSLSISIKRNAKRWNIFWKNSRGWGLAICYWIQVPRVPGYQTFKTRVIPVFRRSGRSAPSACAPEIYYYAEALEMKATQADSTAVVGMEVEDSESSKVDSVCRVVIPGM